MVSIIKKALANYCKLCPGCFVHKKLKTGKSNAEVKEMMKNEVSAGGKAGICPIGKYYDEVYGNNPKE